AATAGGYSGAVPGVGLRGPLQPGFQLPASDLLALGPSQLLQHVLAFGLILTGHGQGQVPVAPAADAHHQPPVEVQAAEGGDGDDEIFEIHAGTGSGLRMKKGMKSSQAGKSAGTSAAGQRQK